MKYKRYVLLFIGYFLIGCVAIYILNSYSSNIFYELQKSINNPTALQPLFFNLSGKIDLMFGCGAILGILFKTIFDIAFKTDKHE